MRDPLKSDPLVRQATEFWHIARDVRSDLELMLPASAYRVREAADVIVHLTIHAFHHPAESERRAWRLRKALRAAAAAKARLLRMRRLHPDRPVVDAAIEVIERLANDITGSLHNVRGTGKTA